MPPPVTPAKRRVIDLLKRLGPTDASALAAGLELTDVAVRQHLVTLEQNGLVEQSPSSPRGRGRPSAVWSLTELAAEIFPDRHADLTVSLIDATRRELGEKGLERVVARRGAAQLEQYRTSLPGPSATLKKRVEALAVQRTAEGYMAEVHRERAGSYVLTEHHCPICEAARTCQGLCAAELVVFRQYLGPDVHIERIAHLMAEGDRCAYRIQTTASLRAGNS